MKNRILLGLAVLMMGLANVAHALGMGELVMESGLHEPLRARIPLLQSKDFNEGQLKVALASERDFVARGLTKDHIYQTIHFTVDLKNKKGPCIVLTTEQPVREPSLDFLVELSWPTGRLLKDFTVLLDHPQ